MVNRSQPLTKLQLVGPQRSWLQIDLKQLAVQAVTNVFNASDLREIWEDSDALAPWVTALDDWKQRLA